MTLAVKKIKVPKQNVEKPADVLSVTERWTAFVQEHMRWIVVGIGVLVALLVLIWGFGLYRESKERSARSAYTRVLESWPTSEATDSQAWERAVSELENFIVEHEGTRPALNAQLDLAQASFRMGRYEDAIKWSEKTLKNASGGDWEALARYQLALVYERAGRADDAIAQWKSLESGNAGALQREAQWHLGNLYSKKEDYARAIEHYEKAISADGIYPSASLLQQELAAVRLRAKSPTAASDADSLKKGS